MTALDGPVEPPAPAAGPLCPPLLTPAAQEELRPALAVVAELAWGDPS